jgi:hypothetical protein
MICPLFMVFASPWCKMDDVIPYTRRAEKARADAFFSAAPGFFGKSGGRGLKKTVRALY